MTFINRALRELMTITPDFTHAMLLAASDKGFFGRDRF
jgi:hypothetical protein